MYNKLFILKQKITYNLTWICYVLHRFKFNVEDVGEHDCTLIVGGECEWL